MKTLWLIAFLLVTSCIIFAQVPQWQWAVSAGGSGEDICYSLAADNQGNAYLAGTFRGSADFGTTTLTSDGETDIFVAKLDSNGNWLWAVKAGGTYYDYAYAIAVDAAGNVYITGSFNYTAAFGLLSLTSSGNTDIYVAKLDTNGGFLWAVRGGGFSADRALNLAVNATGIVITGSVRDDVAFGSHPLTGFGEEDIFIAKLDTDGNWLWARNAGSSLTDEGLAVDLDSVGNVYATGYFADEANFAGTILTSLGDVDIFIAKLSPDGILIAAFRAGGIGEDLGTDIAVDAAGNVWLTGYFMLSIGFGPTVMTSYGNADIFVTKLNSGAIYQWARQAGGLADDVGTAITADNQGNSYVTGYFMDTALFGVVPITGFGDRDAYIAKLDTNGFLAWVVKAGGTETDYGSGIAFSGSGDIYCAGYFESAAVFGNTILTSEGDEDIFVTKLYASNVANDDNVAPPDPRSVLYDAFPNPLPGGKTATIRTEIAPAETGVLSLFNLKGQLLRTYKLHQGTHETTLDSANLTSGIYFYKLQTPTLSSIKKLVLIK